MKSVSQIKKELRNNKRIEECATMFGTTGDITKLKICYLLRHYPALSVGEIASLVGVSISTASHALAKLKTAKIVQGKRNHKLVDYSLTDNSFTKVVLKELFSSQ